MSPSASYYQVAFFKNGIIVPNSTFTTQAPDGLTIRYTQIKANVTLDLIPSDIVEVRVVGLIGAQFLSPSPGGITATCDLVKVD